jgi:hypothetical protein
MVVYMKGVPMFVAIRTLLGDVAADVAATLASTWPFLALSVLAAAAVTTYVGTARLEALLRRRVWLGTVAAVALATLTPFCSCGTTAVLLGGLAASAPWTPLVAFMVSSPLTSPSELMLSAGLFGWPFALVFFVGAIVLGLAAGAVTARIERSGWLRNQTRVVTTAQCSCAADSCSVEPDATADPAATADPEAPAVRAGATLLAVRQVPATRLERWKVDQFLTEVLAVGRRLVPFFLAFTTLGYLVIEAIPTTWITTLVGSESAIAIPLAAVLGIPAYISTEGSLPMVAALMDGGMGPGAALAFLVTGAGTSFGAITGLLVIARQRVIGLVVACLVVGAVVLGWIGNLVL